MRLRSCNDDFLMGILMLIGRYAEKVCFCSSVHVFVHPIIHKVTEFICDTLRILLYLSMKPRSAYLADAPLYIKTETCFHCICIVNFYNNEMKVAVYG